MLIKVNKSFLVEGWSLYVDKLIFPSNYITIIPTGGLMVLGRQETNYIEQTIYLESIEGISEVTKIGLIYVVVIISNGKAISLNATKSDLNILNSAREYIISYRKFIKDYKKDYLSDFSYDENDSSSEVAKNIINKLYNGQLVIDNNKYDLIRIVRKLRINKVFEEFEKLSLLKCDDFALHHELTNYSIAFVKDSTNSKVIPGDYFYSFKESGDLILLRVPLVNLNLYEIESGYLTNNNVNIVDNFLSSAEKVIIHSDEIHDFEIIGTQVSMTNSENSYSTPNALTTMFTEFLFGTSYALLKGMSNQMVRIESKVKDLRLIQVILKDKSDIRFNGVAIYYDFKRYLGEVKNRKKSNSTVGKESYKLSDINSYSKSVLEQMKEFKEMLDLGLISSEEFDKKKKELLNL